MRPHTLALCALGLLSLPTRAHAQYFGRLPVALFETRVARVALGPAMSVEQVLSCRVYAPVQCTLVGWRPVGFSFGAHDEFERALTFAGDGHGRVLASTERDVYYSDDRGESWQRASWNGIHRPGAVAFDADERYGVAVAQGAVHVTEDGGRSWRFVREIPGRTLTQVALSDRRASLADDRGNRWSLTPDGTLTAVTDSSAW